MTGRRTRNLLCACCAALAAAAAGVEAAAVEVRISGLSPEQERNVRAYLSIAAFAEDPEPPADGRGRGGGADADGADARRPARTLTEEDDDEREDTPEALTENRVRRLHAAAGGEIASALVPFGYYDPEVDAQLERSNGDWVARYAVDPGPATVLASVDVRVVGDGREHPDVRAALTGAGLAPGNVLDHRRYETLKRRLFDAAYGAGFIDAAWRRAELRVRRTAREAEVELVLDTGPRYYFGDVIVEQDVLDESFVERFVTITRGEAFDTDRLVALQIALSDSGYFSDVSVDVERERARDRHIPVVVRATPRRTQEYTVGLGYGTDTGPRASIGVELRRINSRGHRFNADLRLSSIEQAIAAEYRIPGGSNPSTDFLALRGSLGNQEIGGWDTRQQSLGAAWHDAWRSFQRRIYVTALHEEFSTSRTPAEAEELLFAGVQLTSKRADDTLFPRRGASWSVDLRAGSGSLLSATDFARMRASTNAVRSLGERIRVLLRAEYGAIGADDVSRVPPSQRFYAGGDGSVRGYGYQKLGPLDSDGVNVGGRYALVASAELEVMVRGDYGAALFVDAGNASNDPWPGLKRGIGIGGRWRSPVGVVGVDIAHPLDDPDTDFRLHLSVGADL